MAWLALFVPFASLFRLLCFFPSRDASTFLPYKLAPFFCHLDAFSLSLQREWTRQPIIHSLCRAMVRWLILTCSFFFKHSTISGRSLTERESPDISWTITMSPIWSCGRSVFLTLIFSSKNNSQPKSRSESRLPFCYLFLVE